MTISVAFFNPAASFSMECRKKWGPTGKNKTYVSFPRQHVGLYKKMSQQHEQVSDMQMFQ